MPTDYNVNGRNVVFSLLIDGNYYPIFCATVNNFNYAQEEIETTNVNSGSASEYVPGMGSGAFDISGMTRIVNDDGRANVAYLLQEAVRRTIHTVQMSFVDNVTGTPNVLTITMNAFITNTAIASSRDTFSNSTINWRITGGLTFGSVIPDPTDPVCEVQDPLYLETVEGEYVVSDSHLVGDDVTILEVQREGVQYDETSGSPAGRRFKYQSSDGSIFFSNFLPFAAGEVVYVLYKIITPTP